MPETGNVKDETRQDSCYSGDHALVGAGWLTSKHRNKPIAACDKLLWKK